MRWLTTLVPIATLLAVAFLVLVVGAPRPVASVRLLGGPTDGLARFSGLLLAEVDGAPLSTARLELFARSEAGSPARSVVTLDGDGMGETSLDFAKVPRSFSLSVTRDGRELARGRVQLSRETWLARAQRRGGYHGGAASGELEIVIAPGRGVFAVPFGAPLFLRVKREGRALAGAELELRSDGAKVNPSRVTTNAEGIARVELTPLEHVVTLQARATAGEHSGTLAATIPIAPGALFVRRTTEGLRVSSPVPRDVAYLTLLNESGRVRGLRVSLQATPEGAESELVSANDLPDGPLWARAASEPFATGTSAVGWPLTDAVDAPAKTLDVRDVLLLDSSAAATQIERLRRRRVLGWAVVVGLVGALTSIATVLLRARRSGRAL
ncbi:MAG TPA: Ig-like domain-containing protein, partial [Polyangiaceae bacterium]|nr:Ig-like domain-containing protein [Polyangiaceae bacterium]